MPAELVLEARGLVKDYRRTRAVDGIDVRRARGRAGRAARAQRRGQDHHVVDDPRRRAARRGRRSSICGFDLARKRSEAAECVGFAAGYLPLTERMRVREYLRLYGQLYGLADPGPRIEEGLERFRITHLAEAMGTELSSGQRTLIGIVRSTLHQPRLLVLDEPTASLDPDVALRVREGLIEIADNEGTALLMTSHDMTDVEQVCERVLFLSHGRIVADGTPASIAARTATATSKACSSTSPATTRPPATNRAITHERRSPSPQLSPRRPVVAAHARDRAPARVRARAQPAPAVRRDALAARRRRAVRLARRVRRHERRVGRVDGRRATCSPGIILWHVIYQSQIAMSTGFLEETWTRNLLNMMVTPVREVEYVAGVALFGMIKLVIGVGVMVLGAFAFFSFDTWSLGFGRDPDRDHAADRRLGDLAVRDRARAAVRYRRRGAGVGRDVRAAAALGRLLSDRRAAHGAAADRAGAAHHPRVRARCAASSTAHGLDWAQVAIAAVGSVVMLLLACWFLVHMLKLFRTRGYITRYT